MEQLKLFEIEENKFYIIGLTGISSLELSESINKFWSILYFQQHQLSLFGVGVRLDWSLKPDEIIIKSNYRTKKYNDLIRRTRNGN